MGLLEIVVSNDGEEFELVIELQCFSDDVFGLSH